MSSRTNVINFNQSRKRVKRIFSEFNSEIKGHGLSVKYRLNSRHEDLINKLISEYGTKLNGSNHDPKVSKELLRVRNNTVSYYANDERVLRDATSNHIRRLEKFGFIIVKRKVRLEITLHPNLIQFNPEVKAYYSVLKSRLMLEFSEKIAEIQNYLKSNNQDITQIIVGKTCLKYITHNYKNNNLINKTVDNLKLTKPKLEKVGSINTSLSLAVVNNQEPQQKQRKIQAKQEKNIKNNSLPIRFEIERNQKLQAGNNNSNNPLLPVANNEELHQYQLKVQAKKDKYYNKTSRTNQVEIDRQKRNQVYKESVQKQVDYLWKFMYTKFYEGKIGINHNIKFMSQSQIDFGKAFFEKQFNNVSLRDLNEKTKEIKSNLNRWNRFLKNYENMNTPLPTVFFGPSNKFSYNLILEWARQDLKEKTMQYLKARITNLFSWQNSASFKTRPIREQLDQIESTDRTKDQILYSERWKNKHIGKTVILYDKDYEELNRFYEHMKHKHENI